MKNLILDEVLVPHDLNIFILEDTEVFQRKMISDLMSIGFKGKVTLTVTVKAALKEVEISKPDLILSDWNLPDGFGIEFLKMVRATETLKNLPFVMVTTIDEIDNILEAVENGADGYIVKPWNLKELEDKIGFAYKKRTQLSLDL